MTTESFISKVHRKLLGTLHFDLDRDPRNTIFLAGSGRSGTTWLSQVLNYRNAFRYIFEPFHPSQIPGSNLPEPNSYLRPHHHSPTQEDAVLRVLSGRVRNRWVDNHNKRLFPRRRLLKDVWANLYLGWISVHFPDVPILYTLRHPCAVANSRVKSHRARGTWKPELERFLSDSFLVEDHLEAFAPHIREAEHADLFEQLIFEWCIENYVPLSQEQSEHYFVISYEQLCTTPDETFPPLLAHIGEPCEHGLLEAVGRASPMRHVDSPIVTGGNLVRAWREQVTDAQYERAMEILTLFGMDRIYGDGDLPSSTPISLRIGTK